MLTSGDAVPGPMPRGAPGSATAPPAGPSLRSRRRPTTRRQRRQRPACAGLRRCSVSCCIFRKAFAGVTVAVPRRQSVRLGGRPAAAAATARDRHRSRRADGCCSVAAAPLRRTKREPLRDHLRVSASYGFSGPTGAHPVSRAGYAWVVAGSDGNRPHGRLPHRSARPPEQARRSPVAERRRWSSRSRTA